MSESLMSEGSVTESSVTESSVGEGLVGFIEQKFGDLDEIFAYKTTKAVRVRDRRLCFINFALQGAIVLYFVVLNIIIKGEHLVIRPIMDDNGLLYIGDASGGEDIEGLGPPGQLVSFAKSSSATEREQVLTNGTWQETRGSGWGSSEMCLTTDRGSCKQSSELYIIAPLILDHQESPLSLSEYHGVFADFEEREQSLSPCPPKLHEAAGILYPSLCTAEGVVKINLGEVLQAAAGDECNCQAPNFVEVTVSWTNRAWLDPFAKARPHYSIRVRQANYQFNLLKGAMGRYDRLRLGPKVVDRVGRDHRIVQEAFGSVTQVRLQVHSDIRVFKPVALFITLSGVLVLLKFSTMIVDFLAQKVLADKDEYTDLMTETSRDFSNKRLAA